MDDENPRIAILGAGPIGLEAALYARYLGYPTQVFDVAAQVAANVLALGDASMGSLGELASRLGAGALRAQDAKWQCPPTGTVLTAGEWYSLYLEPLAKSDLLADVLQLQHEVVGITRRDAEDDVSFVIRCRDAEGSETTHEADIVIDASGKDAAAWFGECAVDAELGFVNPDADVYAIGAKGGAETFAAGLVQIRELFAILGEREDLDVYATMPALE